MRELKPGRELDALVAEKVMGWKQYTFPDAEWCQGYAGKQYWQDGVTTVTCTNEDGTPNCPNYSTNIAAAWAVIEKLRAREPLFRFFMDYNPQALWCVNIAPFPPVTRCESPSHAICLAALRAVGVSIC